MWKQTCIVCKLCEQSHSHQIGSIICAFCKVLCVLVLCVLCERDLRGCYSIPLLLKQKLTLLFQQTHQLQSVPDGGRAAVDPGDVPGGGRGGGGAAPGVDAPHDGGHVRRGTVARAHSPRRHHHPLLHHWHHCDLLYLGQVREAVQFVSGAFLLRLSV